MEIIEYQTAGGKNLIQDYIDGLPLRERLAFDQIRLKIMDDGALALKVLNTRQLRGKLWEIKFSQNRILYAIRDGETIYFLHACKKQKSKAEKLDLDKAIRRAKEFGIEID